MIGVEARAPGHRRRVVDVKVHGEQIARRRVRVLARALQAARRARRAGRAAAEYAAETRGQGAAGRARCRRGLAARGLAAPERRAEEGRGDVDIGVVEGAGVYRGAGAAGARGACVERRAGGWREAGLKAAWRCGLLDALASGLERAGVTWLSRCSSRSANPFLPMIQKGLALQALSTDVPQPVKAVS